MVISTEIIHSVMLPLLIAFAVSVALSPFVIPFLRKLKVGQTERAEGVQSHLKKAGTPTMGGTDHSDQCSGDLSVFCGPLSQDHSGPVSDAGLWDHRFSG